MNNYILRPKASKALGLFFRTLTLSTLVLSATFAADSTSTQEANEVTSAADREINKHSLGLGVGETFLMGGFNNYGDHQITGDLFYTYSASYSFDLVLNAHSSYHEFEDNKVWLNGYTMSIKGRPYEFDNFSPFYLAGLGFYTPRVKDDDKLSKQKTTFGFNLGTGVDLRLNKKMSVGVLGHLHKPFEIKQEEMANVGGSYFKLLITTSYTF
jgi:opacity protein-like surface antigen